MKKILSLLFLAGTIISCRKDKHDSILTDVQSSIDTYQKTSDGAVKLKPLQYKNSDGRIMYALLPPLAGNFQQLARGTYDRGSEVARSLNGFYSLIYQFDGNLVLYKLSSPNDLMAKDPIWATNTLYSQAGTTAKFQTDGNVVLYRPSTSGGEIAYWSGNVFTTNPIWILQDDGNLVGYKSYYASFPQLTGMDPYASTNTQGGNISNYFGKFRK